MLAGLPELPTGTEDDAVVQDKVQSILEMGHRLAKEGKAQGKLKPRFIDDRVHTSHRLHRIYIDFIEQVD